MTVAAIIPTAGRPEVRRAVASAVAQDVDVDVIVVLAVPHSERLVEAALGGLSDRVRMIPTDVPLNGSQARNIGVSAAAEARFVAFLDDDDWWHPSKTRRQLEIATRTDPRSVISTGTLFGVPTGPEIDAAIVKPRSVPEVPYTDGRLADYLLARPRLRYGRHFMQTSSLLGRTEVFRDHPWDEALPKHQDWDLLIRLVDGGGYTHHAVTEALTYVAQGSQASISKVPDWHTSLRWLETLNVSARPRNDFILANVVRPCLVARKFRGVFAALKSLSYRQPPHLAAVVGLAAGLRRHG